MASRSPSYFLLLLLLPNASLSVAPPTLRVSLHSPHALPPTRSTPLAAGYDLYSSNPSPVALPPFSTTLLPTDITVSLPPGTYGRIAERSGLALKQIGVGGGVIDRDYRGRVGVVLRNFGDSEYIVQPNSRVAQLVLERIVEGGGVAVVGEGEALWEEEEGERGERGFGSSGD